MNGRQRQTRMRKLWLNWLAAAVVFAFVLGLGRGMAHAANGDLDSDFDGDGRVTTDLLGYNNGAEAVAIQSNGKIVAVGNYSIANGSDFFVTRYNPDGSLDTSFDDNGLQIISFNNLDEANAVAIQSDGKIVVAGITDSDTSSGYDFAVARLNTNGSLDVSFNFDGKATTDFAGESNVAEGVAIQADGRIVAAGYTYSSSYYSYFALARYNANGYLDTSFSFDGKVTTGFSGIENRAHGVTIQSDGKIVAAGTADTSSGSNFALARYNTNGSLDSGFSGDGKVTTDFLGEDDGAHAVALQSDGKIVAAGYAHSGSSNNDFGLARYNSTGTLDTGFSSDGKVTASFGSDVEGAHGVAIRTDGKIVAAGYTVKSSDSDFALAIFSPVGTLNPTFSNDGKVTTDFSGEDDRAEGVAIQADGKIVLAGVTGINTPYEDFALARYQAGSLSKPDQGNEK